MKKNIILLLSVFMMTFAGICPAYANETSTTIKGTYYPPFTSKTSTHEFDYDGKWFDSDASIYNQKLAQLSIGLANTGNHATSLPIETCDQYIKKYTQSMGFTNGESEQFNETPTKDTIGSYISSQQMDGYTLVCVGLRGQGYMDEWMSNFNVGEGVRHNGFDAAAKQVEARIQSYLTKYNITGKKKLWIAGFSRAAAVSNITAADMKESGLFDDVFAYCFACPRTTKETGNYTGIFNIIGTRDVVPMVGFADWGFGRFGTDKFISAQEVDSEYGMKILENDVAHPNATIRNNVIVNHQLHVLCEYLLNLCPSSEDYVELLQDRLIEAWSLKDDGSFIAMLPALLNDIKSVNTHKTKEFNEMLDYLMTVIGEYLQDGVTIQENHEGWNLDDSIGSNLFLEHNCQTYLNWMFASDDPNMIFTENTANIRFVLSSKEEVTVDIYDSYGYVQSVNSKGEIFYRDVENVISRTNDNIPVLYTHKVGSQVIIIIPEDEKYMLTLSSEKDATVEYFATRYDGILLEGNTSPISELKMEAGKNYFVVSQNDQTNFLSGDKDSSFSAWDSSLPYSPSLVMHLENLNVLHLSFQQMIVFIISIIVFIVGLIVLNIITAIRRKIKHLKVNRTSLIFIQVISAIVFFIFQQIAGYYMPAVPQIKMIFGVLTMLSALLLALSGYMNTRRHIDLYITLDLLLCLMGEVLYVLQWQAGVACYIVATVLLCVGLIKHYKTINNQWIIIAILGGLLAITCALKISSMTGIMSVIIYLCYSIVAMLLAIMTWKQQ